MRDLPSLKGTIIVTSFKIIFKPSELQPNLRVKSELDAVAKSHIQDYFRMPLGLIYSVEIKTSSSISEQHSDSRTKQSKVEILGKD